DLCVATVPGSALPHFLSLSLCLSLSLSLPLSLSLSLSLSFSLYIYVYICIYKYSLFLSLAIFQHNEIYWHKWSIYSAAKAAHFCDVILLCVWISLKDSVLPSFFFFFLVFFFYWLKLGFTIFHI